LLELYLTIVNKSLVNQGADLLATHRARDVAFFEQIEHHYRQPVVTA
jgi:hypothetical protein